jgi:hypothetical protein
MNPLDNVHRQQTHSAQPSPSTDASEQVVQKTAQEKIQEILRGNAPNDLQSVRERLALLQPLLDESKSMSLQTQSALKTLRAAESKFAQDEHVAANNALIKISEIGTPPRRFIFFKGEAPSAQVIALELSMQLSKLNRYLRVSTPFLHKVQDFDYALNNLKNLEAKFADDPTIPLLAKAVTAAIDKIQERQDARLEHDLDVLGETSWEDEIKEVLPQNVSLGFILANNHVRPLLRVLYEELRKSEPNTDYALAAMQSIVEYEKSGNDSPAFRAELKGVLATIIQNVEDPRFFRLLHVTTLNECDTKEIKTIVEAPLRDVYAHNTKSPQETDGVLRSHISVQDLHRLGSVKVNEKNINLNFKELSEELMQQGMTMNEIVNLEAWMNQATLSETTLLLASKLPFGLVNSKGGDQRWAIELSHSTITVHGAVSYVMVHEDSPQNPIGFVATKVVLTVPRGRFDTSFGKVEDFTGVSLKVVLGEMQSFGASTDDQIDQIKNNAKKAIDSI